MVEFSFRSLDDKAINNEENVFKTVYFPTTIPKKRVSRILTIDNLTEVKVKYHWSLFTTNNSSNISLIDIENHHFSIEPMNGNFEPKKSISFTISFCADNPSPYYEYACLIIDDIPFPAIKNPSESLKKKLLENKGTGAGFEGSNINRPSITYFELELVARVSFCKIEVSPSFYVFPNKLLINKEYSQKFKIKNISDVEVKFFIKSFENEKNNVKYRVDINKVIYIFLIF